MVGLANWQSQQGMQAGEVPWLMQGATEAVNKGVNSLSGGIQDLVGNMQKDRDNSAIAGLMSGAHSYDDIQNKIAANPNLFASLNPEGQSNLLSYARGMDNHALNGAQIGAQNASTDAENARTRLLGVQTDEEPQKLAMEKARTNAAVNASYLESALRRQQMSQNNTIFNQGQQDRNAQLGAAQVEARLNDTPGFLAWQKDHPGGTLPSYKYGVLSSVTDPQIKSLVYREPGNVRLLQSAAGPDTEEGINAGDNGNKLTALPSDNAVARQHLNDLNDSLDDISKNNTDVVYDHRQLEKFSAPNMNRSSAIREGLSDDDMGYARGLNLTGNNIYKGAYLRKRFNEKYGSTLDENTRRAYILHNLDPQADTVRNNIYSQQAHVDALKQRYAQNVAFLTAGMKHAYAFRGSNVITPEYNANLSNVADENERILRQIEEGLSKLRNARQTFNPDAPIDDAYSSIQDQIPANQRDVGNIIGYSKFTGVGGGY